MFQRCIQETLVDCPGTIPYIDNILVFGWDKQEQDRNLECVLCALHNRNLHLHLSKCQFRQSRVKYLGHILAGIELRLNPEMVSVCYLLYQLLLCIATT